MLSWFGIARRRVKGNCLYGHECYERRKFMIKTKRMCQIKCRVSPGIFKDERVVGFTIVDVEGNEREAQTITSSKNVDQVGEGGVEGQREGRLKAYCVKLGREFASIILPQATIENGTNVRVPRTELVED